MANVYMKISRFSRFCFYLVSKSATHTKRFDLLFLSAITHGLVSLDIFPAIVIDNYAVLLTAGSTGPQKTMKNENKNYMAHAKCYFYMNPAFSKKDL